MSLNKNNKTILLKCKTFVVCFRYSNGRNCNMTGDSWVIWRHLKEQQSTFLHLKWEKCRVHLHAHINEIHIDEKGQN